MKNKVLFILPTLHAGGAENYALRFITYYQHEFDFYVLSVNTQKGDLHDQFDKVVKEIIYQSIGYFNPIKGVKTYLLFKKKGFDAICSFNGNFGGYSLTIGLFAGVKRRIAFYRRSTNAFGDSHFKVWYNYLSILLVRKNATHILSNSRFALENFHGSLYQSDTRFKIIPNGVDSKLFDISISKEEARKKLNLPNDVFIVGHVGRYDPAKNHETIFKVACELKKWNKDVRFLFCGKDTDSPPFLKQLKVYGIEDICYPLGLQENVPEVFKTMDLFYFPSVTEGQPNALIEAMLAGVPVITSNIPPILDCLPHCSHSKMIPPAAANLFINQIQNLIDSKETLKGFQFKEWANDQYIFEKNINLFKNEIV